MGIRNYDETDAGKPPTSKKNKNSEAMAVLGLLSVVAMILTDILMGNWMDAIQITLTFCIGIGVSANIKEPPQ